MEKNYYRLKQVDFNGQFEYSKIVHVKIESTETYVGNFYPNPSYQGEVNLEYITVENSELEISVFDMSGKYFYGLSVEVVKGKNNLNFDFKDLAEGVYLVKIKNESTSIFRKLVMN